MTMMSKEPAGNLEFRLRHGYLSINEMAAMKKCGRTKIYEDIAAGRLEKELHGGRRRIKGPIAAAYVPRGKRASAAA